MPLRRFLLLLLLVIAPLRAFESTNVQLLYSNAFDGDAFIYDTVDGEKLTLTFEHFRTFDYGDLFLFVDFMQGEKFDGTKDEIYAEFSPRFSLSKLSRRNLSFAFVSDIYIATQLNEGYGYHAYLGGVGADLTVTGFLYCSLNLYYKSENINDKDTFQITSAYRTDSLHNIYVEGFIDITGRDINTHNQLLYAINEHLSLGGEWIYYHFDDDGVRSTTNALEAMIKYRF